MRSGEQEAYQMQPQLARTRENCRREKWGCHHSPLAWRRVEKDFEPMGWSSLSWEHDDGSRLEFRKVQSALHHGTRLLYRTERRQWQCQIAVLGSRGISCVASAQMSICPRRTDPAVVRTSSLHVQHISSLYISKTAQNVAGQKYESRTTCPESPAGQSGTK